MNTYRNILAGLLASGLCLLMGQELLREVDAKQTPVVVNSAIRIQKVSHLASIRCDKLWKTYYKDSENNSNQWPNSAPQVLYSISQLENEIEDDYPKREKDRTNPATAILARKKQSETPKSAQITCRKLLSTQTFYTSPKRGPPVIQS